MATLDEMLPSSEDRERMRAKIEEGMKKAAGYVKGTSCPIPTRSSGFIRCVEEECAWWDQMRGQCYVKTIADAAIIGRVFKEPMR